YPAAKWKYEPVTDEEVSDAIDDLKPYKKSKIGTPSNAIFVKAKDLLVPFLAPLFRATDIVEFYPSDWK
ncbi:hypothetical protein BJ165DRAFT_1325921, partial [Panaeolus papilionaceus]